MQGSARQRNQLKVRLDESDLPHVCESVRSAGFCNPALTLCNGRSTIDSSTGVAGADQALVLNGISTFSGIAKQQAVDGRLDQQIKPGHCITSIIDIHPKADSGLA